MATIYSKERGKYGNITGQIIVWPVEVDNTITSSSSKRDLPAGYLRCDGTVYNAVDYPQLAAVCGTGTGGKFVRKNISNEPLQTISNEQFAVPDLGSKCPKPTGAAGGGGTYTNIRITTENGVEKSRSGIGIDADAIGAVDNVITVEYTGNFIIPSTIIPMRGRPAWTVGTTDGRRTEIEAVDSSQLHGHMHFHSGTRTRLKSRAEVDENSPNTVKPPAQSGPVGLRNASTIPLHAWIVATSLPTSGNLYPGNAQQPCKAIASNQLAKKPPGQGKEGAFAGTWNPTSYGYSCINDNSNLTELWAYYCLLPPESYLNDKGVSTAGNGSTTRAWEQYPIKTPPYTVTGDSSSIPTSESRLWNLGLCNFPGGGTYGSDQDVEAMYRAGATGVPIDWMSLSWADSVPLQTNDSHQQAGSVGYPSTTNTFEQSEALYTGGEDPTEHYHKLNIVKEDHTYELKTDSTELPADLLNTTLQLSVDESKSVDNVTAPFIILEYLIKI